MTETAPTPVATIHAEPTWNEHWAALEIGAFDDTLVLIMRLFYTSAIITVPGGNPLYYDERWCYHDHDAAIDAAQAWLRDSCTSATTRKPRSRNSPRSGACAGPKARSPSSAARMLPAATPPKSRT